MRPGGSAHILRISPPPLSPPPRRGAEGERDWRSDMTLAARSTADERMDTDCVDFDDYRRCLRDLSRVNTVTMTHRPMLSWLAHETTGLQSFSLLDVACGHG